MRHRSFCILFVYFLVISPSIAEDKALPFDLLGKELKDLPPQYDVFSFSDSTLTDRRWIQFVIDKDRCYLTLRMTTRANWEDMSNKTISEIYIHDPCYSTRKNIRVGDSFSKVRAAYPDAKFIAGQYSLARGIYDLITNDGKIAFWFDDHEIWQMIYEGEMEIEDEIKKMELLFMRIRIEPHMVIGKMDGLNSEQVADALYQSGRFNRVSSYTDGRSSPHADDQDWGRQGRFIDWTGQENGR